MKHYIETIEVRNEAIFGDKESHVLEMDFLDGYAISTDKLFGMSYPTIEQVKKTEWMQKDILAYCGDDRKGDCTFDIALKFGVLFVIANNVKMSKQIEYLEGFIQPEDQEEYKNFCKSLDAPERDYFVLFHDRTGDGGMSISYLGKMGGVSEAENMALQKGIIPSNRTRKVDDAQREILYEVVLQDDTTINSVYVDNSVGTTEYWAVISREYNPEEKYGVLVWNRDSNSNEVQNMFYVFDSFDAMDKCVKEQKESELCSNLDMLNDSWFIQTLKGNYGLQPVQNGIKNLHVWADDGYEVDIISGTYK